MPQAGEEFRDWIRSSSQRPFYIGGHRFEKSISGEVRVDRGVFDLEEAEQVGEMLLSINPVAKLSAQVAIWEKNGILLKVVLVGAILLLALALIIVRS